MVVASVSYWGLLCPHMEQITTRKGPGHGILTNYCNTGEPQSSSADTRCVRFLNSVQSPDCYISTKVSTAPGQRDVPSLSCRHCPRGKQGQKRHSWDHVICVLHTEQTLLSVERAEPSFTGKRGEGRAWERVCELWFEEWGFTRKVRGTEDKSPLSRGDIRTEAATKTVARHPSSTAHIWTPATSQAAPPLFSEFVWNWKALISYQFCNVCAGIATIRMDLMIMGCHGLMGQDFPNHIHIAFMSRCWWPHNVSKIQCKLESLSFGVKLLLSINSLST